MHRMTEAERSRLLEDLVRRIADRRNLYLALLITLRKGDRAPGPDGERIHDAVVRNRRRVNHRLKALGRRMLEGRYRPEGTRTSQVPKGTGGETRPIEIQNSLERIGHRAVAQILEAIVDPTFGNECFGFRPGRSRNEALATLAEQVERGNSHLVLSDIRKAFDNVPIGPLLATVRKRVGHPATRLVRDILGGRNRGRGIQTGSPLSGLLLNVLLDEVLDSKLRKQFPGVSVVRWVDDIACTCPTKEEAQEVHAAIVEALRPNGMQLKGSPEADVIEMTPVTDAVWLGMRIRIEGGRVRYQLAAGNVRKLRDRIAKEINAADGVFRVQTILRAIPAQCGAIEDEGEITEPIRQLVEAATEAGCTETPSEEELLATWKAARLRYTALRDLIRKEKEEGAGGRGFAGGQTRQWAGLRVPEDRRTSAILRISFVFGSNGENAWATSITWDCHRARRVQCGGWRDERGRVPEIFALLQAVKHIPLWSRLYLSGFSTEFLNSLRSRHFWLQTLRNRETRRSVPEWRQWLRLHRILVRQQIEVLPLG